MMFGWKRKHKELKELLETSEQTIKSYKLGNRQLESRLVELKRKCKNQDKLIKKLYNRDKQHERMLKELNNSEA